MLQYFLFHKPYRVLSQFSREDDKKTLADFFPHIQKDIYPVGRLDYDSEGLLLLTNDKTLTHQLLDPSFAHPRTYWVQVEGVVTQDALRQLRDGITISIDGKKYHTQKCKAEIIQAPDVYERDPPVRYRKTVPDGWLSLTLIEGKNRQVRHMTAAAGLPTLRLIRAAIGDATLGKLAPGEFREVSGTIKTLLLRK